MSVEAHGGRTNLLRIGDLARLSGKTARAIHLYEELGLLHPATRSSGGFRLYDPVAVERLKWIDLVHRMGFSLQEMKELLRDWWSAGLGPEAMARLRDLFRARLERTREALRLNQQLERELVEGLRYLETCRVCDSPASVSGCVRCPQDHGMTMEPALVAGIVNAPVNAGRVSRSGLVRIEGTE